VSSRVTEKVSGERDHISNRGGFFDGTTTETEDWIRLMDEDMFPDEKKVMYPITPTQGRKAVSLDDKCS
jgi:hypothetical protein